MKNDKLLLAGKLALLVIIAIVSIFVIAGKAASPEFHTKSIESLDKKRNTVLKLTAASTASSAAVSLIPGDAGTPIAEKLADLSSNFMIVLCAIFLEKYLLTITGYATFYLLIPAACLLYGISLFAQKRTCTILANKVLLFGIAIFLVVPVSVKASDLIEATYQTSIEQNIKESEKVTKNISSSNDKDENILEGLVSKVKDGASLATTKIKTILNNFIEALAVMIVTSCILPILVMVFFMWLVKIILGVNVDTSGIAGKIKGKTKINMVEGKDIYVAKE